MDVTKMNCPMCGDHYGNCQVFRQYDLFLCEDCTDPGAPYVRVSHEDIQHVLIGGKAKRVSPRE